MPKEVAAELAQRIEAATVAKIDAQEVCRIKERRWRQLVMEAIDEGVPVGQVAKVAGVVPSRIIAVIETESKR